MTTGPRRVVHIGCGQGIAVLLAVSTSCLLANSPASVVGLVGSVHWDLPAAPSILVTLTAMLLLHGAALSLWRGRGARASA